MDRSNEALRTVYEDRTVCIQQLAQIDHRLQDYNNGSVFAMWQVTPATELEVGYDLLKSHGDSMATYHQVTLAADYALSKRTDLTHLPAMNTPRAATEPVPLKPSSQTRTSMEEPAPKYLRWSASVINSS